VHLDRVEGVVGRLRQGLGQRGRQVFEMYRVLHAFCMAACVRIKRQRGTGTRWLAKKSPDSPERRQNSPEDSEGPVAMTEPRTIQCRKNRRGGLGPTWCLPAATQPSTAVQQRS